ncbi:MAG: hypothetical protein H7144_10580 [Burkholderiales bacterium]|nr:hypothetical protein [Phycisphaerae bacterium]
MVQVIMALIRAFVGLLFAFLGILSALVGLYFLAHQNAQLFGSEGALLLIGLLIAAAFSGLSWRLLRDIGRPAAVA